MAKPKNITRNIAENCVVLRFRRQHQSWHETFTLSKFGNSWEKAEKAAKRRRTILLKELPEPATHRGVMTKRNRSGAVGIHFSQRKQVTPSGKVYCYPHFYAKWPGCPKRAGIGWSVNQYGFEEAFALAFLSREMESVDSKEILAKFKRLQRTKRYKEITDQCQLEWV